MNYSQLKDKVTKTKRDISKMRNKKISLEKELTDINEEKNNARKNYNQNYTKEKEDAKKLHKENLLAPYEKKRKETQSELEQLEKDHVEEMNSLTVENMMQQCSSKQDILDEVKESADKLHSVIIDVVGDRFCNELESQLETQELKLEEENLDEMVAYFNGCSAEISKISKSSGKMLGVIDSIQQVLLGIDSKGIQVSTGGIIGISVVLLILTIFCYKYIFPFYLLFLLIVSGLNVLRNYKVLKIILVQKTIRDNVDGIEEMFRQQVLEELDRRTEEANEAYKEDKQNLENELVNLNKEIEQISANSDSSFVFDDDSIREIYEVTIRQKESREDEINSMIRDAETKLQRLYKDLEGYQKQLDEMVGNIQYSYLNCDSIGAAVTFDPNFIVDVNNSKPVFFKHPMTSFLCLYTDEQLLSDFVRLLNLQLRVKLSPSMYSVDIYDPTNLGSSYLVFKPVAKNDKEVAMFEKIFRIFTEEGDFSNCIKDYNEELGNRINTIITGYENIDDYNKFMLSIQSLTESYRFIFIIDPGDRMFADRGLLQQLRNGSSVGMFYHVFMRESDFYNMGNRVQAVLDNIGRIYLLTESGIQQRAKDWILERLSEEK